MYCCQGHTRTMSPPVSRPCPKSAQTGTCSGFGGTAPRPVPLHHRSTRRRRRDTRDNSPEAHRARLVHGACGPAAVHGCAHRDIHREQQRLSGEPVWGSWGMRTGSVGAHVPLRVTLEGNLGIFGMCKGPGWMGSVAIFGPGVPEHTLKRDLAT